MPSDEELGGAYRAEQAARVRAQAARGARLRGSGAAFASLLQRWRPTIEPQPEVATPSDVFGEDRAGPLGPQTN